MVEWKECCIGHAHTKQIHHFLKIRNLEEYLVVSPFHSYTVATYVTHTQQQNWGRGDGHPVEVSSDVGLTRLSENSEDSYRKKTHKQTKHISTTATC